MIRTVVFVLGIIYCAVPTPAVSDDARTVMITIENRAPDIEVIPSIEVFGSPPELFTPALQKNRFEYKFRVSDTDWFNTVSIKITWKGVYQTNDNTKINLDQRINLRIRRDFPGTFSFPVYFSNNRSQPEMSRLELERDINQQFEVYFRASQIATYYRDTLGAGHPLTKRAAKIYFFAAVSLAEQPNYFVVMSDDAEGFARSSFENDKSYPDRANVARSVYWYDLRQVDNYMAKGDCGTARLLLTAFQRLRADEPQAYKARYADNPTALDEKDRIVSTKCNPP